MTTKPKLNMKELIKSKDKSLIKNHSRKFDYNYMNMGQLILSTVKYIQELEDGVIDSNKKEKIIHFLTDGVGIPKDLSNEHLLFLMKNVEIDSVDNPFTQKISYPKDELLFLKAFSEKVKSMVGSKMITPEVFASRIKNLVETMDVDVLSLLDINSYRSNDLVDFDKKLLFFMEKDIDFMLLDKKKRVYSSTSINVSKTISLNMDEIQQYLPIIEHGFEIPLELKDLNSSLTIENTNLFKTISLLLGDLENYKEISKGAGDKKTFTKKIIFDKLKINDSLSELNVLMTNPDKIINVNFDDTLNKVTMYALDLLTKIKAYQPLISNDNIVVNGYFNKFKEIYNEDILKGEADLSSIFESSDERLKAKVTHTLQSAFLGFKKIESSFDKELSNITIEYNKENMNSSFVYDTNYNLTHSQFCKNGQNESSATIVAGGAGIGKTTYLQQMIKTNGGIQINPSSVLRSGSLTRMFEKDGVDLSPENRTNPYTDLAISIFNGELNNGMILFDEGGRTLMEEISKNNSLDIAAFLTLIEPLMDKEKFLLIDALGEKIKLFPALAAQTTLTTNFIPDNVPPEIARRFQWSYADFNYLINPTSVTKLIDNALYNREIERNIDRFSSTSDRKMFLKTSMDIYSTLLSTFEKSDSKNLLKLNDKILNNYSDFSDFIKIAKKIATLNQHQHLDHSPAVDDEMDKLALETGMSKENILEVVNDLMKYLKFQNVELKNIFDNLKTVGYLEDTNVFLSKSIGQIKEKLNITDETETYDKLYDLVSLKVSLDKLNKDGTIKINVFDYISENFEKSGIQVLTKVNEEFNLHLEDMDKRLHSHSFNLMASLTGNSFLFELKNLMNDGLTLPKSYSFLMHSVGDYISINELTDEDRENFINVKGRLISLITDYNGRIGEKYEAKKSSYVNKAVMPFKSTDAPVIGMDKIYSLLNELLKSGGIIDKKLEADFKSATDPKIMDDCLHTAGFKFTSNADLEIKDY